MEEKKTVKSQKNHSKNGWIWFFACGILGLVGGVAMILVTFLMPKEEVEGLTFPTIPTAKEEPKAFSPLTGEAIADAKQAKAPTFCIQTPNGTDGARPQAGVDKAGVVFEAIAEAGITRFAAIYQNPGAAAIGPIRSLRLYYLEWDTPFDCTIVHAGGSDDALAAVRAGGYKDLTENYSYMYRGTYSGRYWNNLFTNAADLRQFIVDRGYDTSNVTGFSRMTPAEAKQSRVDELVAEKLDILKPTDKNVSKLTPKVSELNVLFGGVPAYNVNYVYDVATNKYKRSYLNGAAHEIYSCPDSDVGERNPEDVCEITQLSPSVVVVMVVSERKAEDNYHEDITTIGSGAVYIFQNGTVTSGTWNKASRDEQIKFLDDSGNEIKLIPGQTFVSAIPNYGGVEY